MMWFQLLKLTYDEPLKKTLNSISTYFVPRPYNKGEVCTVGQKCNDLSYSPTGRAVQVDPIKPVLKAPVTTTRPTDPLFKPSLRYDYPLIPPNQASRPIRDEER